MERVFEREIVRGVRLTAVETEKFKTGSLSMTLLTPHSKKTASLNAVLPYVLRRGTARLPDMEAIAATLDDLYGARIEPTLRKKGEVTGLGFYADFPDGAFLPGRVDVLSGVARLMGELLLNPATAGGRLRADYVQSERQNLMDDIAAEVNDKRGYASQRLLELMFRGENYGVSKLGTMADAAKISVFTLTRHYRKLLAEAPIEVFYCGAESVDRVERIVREALAALPRTGALAVPATKVDTAPFSREPREHIQRMDVTQGRLVMGFRLGEAMEEPDHPALMVMNAAFGGSATSRLFLELREKRSLCYSVSSGIDRHKGVLFVSAGIDFDRYEETVSQVLRELDVLKNGCLTDQELESARRSVVSAIHSALDEPGGLEGLYLDRAMLGIEAVPEELAALSEEVRGTDVRRIAQSAVLDCVYFLTGEDRDAENP